MTSEPNPDTNTTTDTCTDQCRTHARAAARDRLTSTGIEYEVIGRRAGLPAA